MLEKLKKRLAHLAEKAAKDAEYEFEKIKLSEQERNTRYDICKSCEKFNHITTQCKVCHCVMSMKTYLRNSSCPINKWGKVDIEN